MHFTKNKEKMGNTRDEVKVENITGLLKKPYVNEVETAAIMCRAVSTLRNDRHLRRGVPYLKIGKRSIRYKTSDIIAAMEACRISFDDSSAR